MDIRYIKRRLWDWGGTSDYCERKQEEMRELIQLRDEMMDTLLQAAKINGMSKGNGTSDPTAAVVEKIVERYTDMIRHIETEITDALKEKERIDDAIAKLPREQQRILQMRYSKGYQWEYIALKVHMSRSNCFYAHDEAIKSLDFFGLFA